MRAADWLGLLRWRWLRDAGAEVARRARLAPQGAASPQQAELLRQRMQDLQRCGRWLPGSRCLDRALYLLEIADRIGAPAVLQIGIVRSSAGLQAHAWVRLGDIILDPDPVATGRYLPMQQNIDSGDVER